MKVPWTTTLGLIVFVTIGLAGCSSSSSGPATSPATLSGSPGSPVAQTAPPSSAPASPAAPAAPASSPSGPADLTPTTTPSAAPTSAAGTAVPPTVPGPTVLPSAAATGSPPPVSAHAVTAFGAVACQAPEVGGAGLAIRLSATVHIKAVVRCETVQRTYPGLGTWTVQLAEVADTNLGPFVADLRTPSQARRTDVMCPDLVILVPWFGVVDDAGNVITPLLPTDACGKPQTAVIAALQALKFRVTQAVRIARSG